MASITTIYQRFTAKIQSLNDLSLLLMRMVLAYGFYIPAKMKWADIPAITSWFESMNYPLPALNAYMAASTEALGVVLLALGLGTRIISIPLILVMLVAITTVHWGNGLNASDNGFEIPLYYILLLLVLMIHGSGKYSLDEIFRNKKLQD